MADDRDGALGAVQRIADAAADAGDFARGRRLHVGGRLAGMEIAQPALELFARFLVGFDGDRRLEARDLLAEQTEAARGDRSEEHTSELQSLMRISYAVFCFKKKQHTTTDTAQPNIYTPPPSN